MASPSGTKFEAYKNYFCCKNIDRTNVGSLQSENCAHFRRFQVIVIAFWLGVLFNIIRTAAEHRLAQVQVRVGSPFFSFFFQALWSMDTVLHASFKGRPGMSDVSPLSGISGLSFDFTLLSPLLFFCLILLLCLSDPFSACWSVLLNFFQIIVQYFSLKDRLFCMAPV